MLSHRSAIVGVVGSGGVSTLLEQEGLTGVQSQTHFMRECSVTVYFTPNDAEIDRRALGGSTAIDDADLLRSLSQLPLGIQWPFAFVEPDDWPRLVVAGQDVVHLAADGLTRVATAPCEIHAISVESSDWDKVSKALSLVSAAARCLVISTDPTVRINASLFGFGLLDGSELVMEPRELGVTDELQHWILAELVYRKSLPSPEFK